MEQAFYIVLWTGAYNVFLIFDRRIFIYQHAGGHGLCGLVAFGGADYFNCEGQGCAGSFRSNQVRLYDYRLLHVLAAVAVDGLAQARITGGFLSLEHAKGCQNYCRASTD